MTATIEQIEDDLGFFDYWEDRYRYLIDLGKALPAMPEDDKVEDNIVHGCTSQVWLTVNHKPDTATVELNMDSDALIVRGLLALVRAAYADRSPAEIVSFDMEALFARLDLLSHLSMTRGNGLRAMVGRVQKLTQELINT